MPTALGTHTDQYLTNYLQKLTNQDDAFIAERAMTVIPVNKDSDKYGKFKTNHLVRVRSGRGPGSPPNTVDYEVDDATYTLAEHTLRDLVPDEELDNADSPWTPREDALAGVRERVLLDREAEAADLLFDTSNWDADTTLSGSDQWSDDESDPFGNIAEGQNEVLKRSLRKATHILMGWEVFNDLKNHPDIRARINPTSRESVTPAILAALFDVEMVLVGSAVENDANEGQDASMSYIWGKHCLIYYVSPRPGLRTVTGAAMFRRRGFPLAERYRHHDQGAKADYVAYGDKWDMAIPHSGAGYMIENAVA